MIWTKLNIYTITNGDYNITKTGNPPGTVPKPYALWDVRQEVTRDHPRKEAIGFYATSQAAKVARSLIAAGD